MVFKIERLKFKRDFDKIQALTYLQVLFVILAFIDEWSTSKISISILIFKILFFLGMYRLNYKLKAKFNYSYWAFSCFLFAYYFIHAKLPIFFSIEIYHLFYFTLMFVLGIEMYLLSSPIYYPRVMWWEYDFRYRDDLKIDAQIGEKITNGRLTDLRRNAGCILLFNDLKIGSFFKFTTKGDGHQYKVRIISKRIDVQGRPISYGVKFVLHDLEQKQNYKKFASYYRNEKKTKRELKLSKIPIDNA